MNIYGLRIREHWEKYAPIRFAQLENPDSYFTELGDLVANQIVQITVELELKATLSENYLQRVGELNALRRQAEEIVMSDQDWPAPEMTDQEVREEWESTSPHPDNLLEWAHHVDPEELGDEEIEEKAAEWMVPTAFISGLVSATNPWAYSKAQPEILKRSLDSRFNRYLASSLTDGCAE